MSLSPADRQWVLRQLRRFREEIRDDHRLALQEVLGEETALAVFQAMRDRQPPVS